MLSSRTLIWSWEDATGLVYTWIICTYRSPCSNNKGRSIVRSPDIRGLLYRPVNRAISEARVPWTGSTYNNTSATKTMVVMTNKTMAAYLTHVLPSLGMGETFIKNLLKALVDPLLSHEMVHCTWGAKTFTRTTPKAANPKEEECWKCSLVSEGLWDLDDDHMIKILNERPQKYIGSSGAATIILGNNKMPRVIDVDKGTDNLSRESKMKECQRMSCLECRRMTWLKC